MNIAYYSINSYLPNRLATIGLVYVLCLAYNSLDPRYTNFTFYNDWIKIDGTNIPYIFILIILIASLLIYVTAKRKYMTGSIWIYVLVYINIIGLVLFPMVNDLLLMYILIELQSYSLYIITGIYRKSYNATRGAILYFVTGGIASIGLLVGIYFIYSQVGTCNIIDITNYYILHNTNTEGVYDGMTLVLLALVFKMGLAPLHSWSVAVYNYAPTYITAYISIVAKFAIMSWIYSNAQLIPTGWVLIIFFMSLFVGAISPLYQSNIKTILAYSGILNMAYVLIPACLGTDSFYIYLVQYLITHVLIFNSLLASNEEVSKPQTTWSPVINVNRWVVSSIILSIIIIVAFLSLIGIPPLPGFFGKYFVLQDLIENNLLIESISIVIFSVIATYYYAYVIRRLYQNYMSSENTNIDYPKGLSVTISYWWVIFITFFTSIGMISELLIIYNS